MIRNENNLEPTPFLKWPGGKRWLAPVLEELLKGELEGTYYEPFLGAGAVFLRLKPLKASLSDANSDLVTFLRIVREHPEDVVRRVWRWTNDRACYEQVRASKPRTEIGNAARFLYLNRTCWGGVYRTNKEGEFNVPFGNSGRRICSMEHVKHVATAFATADLQQCDFEAAMSVAGKGDAVYADPPYTGKGEDNGFLRYNEKIFSWADQERLASVSRSAKRRGAFVAVSGLHHPELFRLYNGWWTMTMKRFSAISRTTASRRHVSEVLILSRMPKSVAFSSRQKLRRIDGT